MTKEERLSAIIELLEKNNFATVAYLSKELHYSHATINRDLNELDRQGLIKRVWGGVETVKTDVVPLLFRYEKSKSSKMKVAKAAAALVNDGDTVIIDGATTTQYIGQYLIKKKRIHVITNNIALASYLSKHDIWVTVLGGDIVDKPYMTDGDEAIEMLSHYYADIAFFATSSITSDGLIGDCEKIFWRSHKEMINRSKQIYYLMDHEKLDTPLYYVTCDLGSIHGIISDCAFPESLHKKYPRVRFIELEDAANSQ